MKSDPRRQIESAAVVFSPMVLAVLYPGSLLVAFFLMGTLIELLRVAPTPKEAAIVAAVLLGFSFITLLNGGLARNLPVWPLVYAFILVLGVAILYQRRLTPRIGEGNALVASLAFMSWMVDRYLHDGASAIPLVLALVPFLYVLTHALTNIRLTSGHRLALSLWTTAVLVALSVRYVLTLRSFGWLDVPARSNDLLGAFVELFLLGASGPVLALNAFMLAGYLPDRKRLFQHKYWGEYARESERLSHDHVERFSPEQVPPPQALVALLIAVALMVARHFNVVSIDFVIAFLIAGVPWIMRLWTVWASRGSRSLRATP